MLRNTFQLLAILGLAHWAWACYDPGVNVCASGKADCKVADSRIVFDDGMLLGAPSSTYAHDDLTQGCYCQYTEVETIFPAVTGESTITTESAIGNNTYVTSCSPNFNVWWDGTAAMNTSDGTLGIIQGYGYTRTYDKMACTMQAPLLDDRVIIYVDWPTANQSHLEQLPSNIAFFDGDDDLCPGYDSQDGFLPNKHKTATIPQASDVQNCSCHNSIITAVGNTGYASSNDGNSMWTVCNKAYTMYFNGLGFRQVRTSDEDADGNLIRDYCHGQESSAAEHLAYVSSGDSGTHGSSGSSDQHDGTQRIEASTTALFIALAATFACALATMK